MTPDETPTPETEATKDSQNPVADRQTDFTRRALIQAGWIAPVVLAATLPQRASAQSGNHTDGTGFLDANDFCDGSPAEHCDIVSAP
jgi:hypothetical protein